MVILYELFMFHLFLKMMTYLFLVLYL